MQGQQLLTESQVFEDEVFPRTKSPDNPAEDIPERHDHGKNLIGTVGIETFAKSLILRGYDVLARHSLKKCFSWVTNLLSSVLCARSEKRSESMKLKMGR